jgi:hypothetical protein
MWSAIFGSVFVAWAALELVQAVFNIVHGHLSNRWPLVAAEIIDSGVRKRRFGLTGRGFAPFVIYTYAVDGVLFRSERILFAPMATPSRADADRFVCSLPPGMKIEVRVSPTNPRLAVIEPGIKGAALLQVFAAVTFGVVGIVAVRQIVG